MCVSTDLQLHQTQRSLLGAPAAASPTARRSRGRWMAATAAWCAHPALLCVVSSGAGID